MQKFDWYSSAQVLALPIAKDWAKPFRNRVAAAKGRDILIEAGRATLEAVSRQLRSRKWQRRRTSTTKWDGRAASRYYRSPHDPDFEIRISDHDYPRGTYSGYNYIVTGEVMLTSTINQLVHRIVRDERAFQMARSRKAKQTQSR
jgi:hypothetical protein